MATLGVIENVPARMMGQRPIMVRLSIERAKQTEQQILDPSKEHLLNLMIDSPHMYTLIHTHRTDRVLEASSIERVNGSIIIRVSFEGGDYVLKCDKTMIHSEHEGSIVSETEQAAESLNLVKDIHQLNGKRLFAELHAHGRLWETTHEPEQTETWEVLLIDDVRFRSISSLGYSTFFQYLSTALAQLRTIHQLGYAYGRPTLGHLAFPYDEESDIVWVDGLSVKALAAAGPLTQNVLKLRDITSLLLDNQSVLGSLGVTKLVQVDFERLEDFEVVLMMSGHQERVRPIMPFQIVTGHIDNGNCYELCKRCMPPEQIVYWNNVRTTQLQHLWTSLTHMETLKSIVEGLAAHYNKSRPVAAPSIPVLHQIHRNTPYPLMINQQPVSPKGNPALFYKYMLDGPGSIVLGTGFAETFHVSHGHPVYCPVFSTNTVAILKDWSDLPGIVHAPLSFTFHQTQPHNMQVVVETRIGTLLWQVLDLRFSPPMLVYSKNN